MFFFCRRSKERKSIEKTKPLVGRAPWKWASCSPTKVKPHHPFITTPYTAAADVSALPRCPHSEGSEDLHSLRGPVPPLQQATTSVTSK